MPKNSDKRVAIKVVMSNSIQVATPYQTLRIAGYETHKLYSLLQSLAAKRTYPAALIHCQTKRKTAER